MGDKFARIGGKKRTLHFDYRRLSYYYKQGPGRVYVRDSAVRTTKK